MEQPQSPNLPPMEQLQSSNLPPMDSIAAEDPSSSMWDLSYFLDFNLDDVPSPPSPFNLPSPPSPFNLPLPDPPPPPDNDRVRKRDPKLACPNFLAGRVPCACPELDAKLDEEGLPGKKRARSARASSASARCQVPDCEVDITELKGYHRRHRVCLRCANAATVLLNGESKRYCQQCGKFHVLSDFDEGKRSCRRKLERHNNRRRRKPADSVFPADHEPQSVTQNEDFRLDGEVAKDCSNLSSEINEKGVLPDHEDGPVNVPCSALDSQNINSDNAVSFAASGETQVNSGRDVSNISNSPSDYDNKSGYSSMCQTGRVSFKLYDWNPAEFPRRLRHQIFEWLANMPVELEGYIRPGCTILTMFIAMPNVMWINLHKDTLDYVRDLVAPGKMLSGRGAVLVHLNDLIFHVMKDGASLTKVKVNMQAPRLHYVHPTYFEAGKPMQFVACGSNLLQPKFRLLISFSGKYLKYEYCVPSPHNWTEDNISCAFDNHLYEIHVPHTDVNLFGPAFIEVENESGLSNFIPVFIGDKETCNEMKTLQQKVDISVPSEKFQSAPGSSICSSCEAFAHRHTSSSDLLVDIAWSLKDPTSENFDRVITVSQIQRYCHLLDFLICKESTIILGKIWPNLVTLTESMKSMNRASDENMTQLLKCIDNARVVINQKHQKVEDIAVHSEMDKSCSEDDMLSVVAVNSQGILSRADAKLGVLKSPTSDERNERTPLLKRDIIMNVAELPKRCERRFLARGRFLSYRPAIFAVVSVAVCLGVCVAVVHHGRVSELAVSIRRCLFN